MIDALYRDAPEATGEEPDDQDFDMPKIYEPVSCTTLNQPLHCVHNANVVFLFIENNSWNSIDWKYH